MTDTRKIPYKIYLEENEMPTQWYNVRADMKNKPAPLLNPQTLKPMTAEELSQVPSFPSGAGLLSGKRIRYPRKDLL